MLPKTAEYALRAIVLLGSEPGCRISAGKLARRTNIPRRYLHTVLQAMVHGGFLDSHSGPGGGYALRRLAEKITVLDVVNTVAPLQRLRRCPLGRTSHNRLCRLHQELDRIYEEVEKSFSRLTIAELLRPIGKISVLCENS